MMPTRSFSTIRYWTLQAVARAPGGRQTVHHARVGRERTSLLILAGGRGTRLGGARKALLQVGGQPILARVLEALGPLADDWVALVDEAGWPTVPGLTFVVDATPHGGVLPALARGLRQVSGEVCMLVAGDMPFVQRSAFDYLLRLRQHAGASVVIPRVDGFLQPMHCVVERQVVLDAVEVGLAAGEQRLFRVLEPLHVRVVEADELRTVDPDLLTLFNVNTPEDLRSAQTRASDLADGAGWSRWPGEAAHET
jgi:molybdenum cofactor guanylyltransferase